LKRLKHCNKYTYFNILIFLLYIFARSGWWSVGDVVERTLFGTVPPFLSF
jgi:hypothetical protein